MIRKLCSLAATCLVLICSTTLVSAGGETGLEPVRQRQWVDSVFQSLTPTQRLGQLFMVAAFSNKDNSHVAHIDRLITEYNIGGLMFMQGGPYRQAVLTNRYQHEARVPLLIAIDAEWGLSMRLDSSMQFAKQMTLGAIEDHKYAYVLGREMALKLKRMGVHVSFSPVVDINNNPKNPVIGMRSFGEDKQAVTQRAVSYIEGLQDNGIIAVAKHFPGHGDTDLDSHYALPIVNKDYKQLSELELYPFRKSFDAGVMGVMVAHLHMPRFDTTTNRASTLSPAVVKGLLKEQMGYRGLVFTDALNMKGVREFYKPGQVDVLALLAGNDVLLFAEDVPTAITGIQEAISTGQITQEEVDLRVRKILRAKYWAGLSKLEPVKLENLKQDVDRPWSSVVQQTFYEHATTVVANKNNLLPFRKLDKTNFASVSIGLPLNNNPFQDMLGNYAPFTHYALAEKYSSDSTYLALLETVSTGNHDVVVVGVHGLNQSPLRDFGVSSAARMFIDKLRERTKVIVVVFGNPYSLKFFDQNDWLVCAYEDNAISQQVVPQILFGAIDGHGKLPITASYRLPAGTGHTLTNLNRLRYGKPESVGLDSKILAQIDNIATEAIAYAATPGCQVLVAKDGAVVFNKAYGYYTYDKQQPVTTNTLYDIASVTKVAGTLQAIMYLKDQGLLDLNAKASAYLPELVGTNKENLVIRDILMHQAGLIPFIPHWKRTIDSVGLRQNYYASTRNDLFSVPVANGIYCMRNMEDSLWAWTIQSKLLPKNAAGKYDYKYSDLSFYILKRVADELLNQRIDVFLEENFYQPLGLWRMTYNPLDKFPASAIAPTEIDNYFRRQLLQGTVHDQGAALCGGVGGHAGLFSNTNDLAVLMQMNLQNGNYGGQQYFKKKVVTEFSKRQSKASRRGLGWDKPEPGAKNGPTSELASANTFGHTGFTGTCVWVDPDTNLVYIFLSNRIYPDAENTKLVQYNIRTRIHDVIYKSIMPKN